MTVKTKKDAWAVADLIMKHDYVYDEERSKKAGCQVYFTTAEDGSNEWISDLNDRLEVNSRGVTTNIWIMEGMRNPSQKILEERIEELKAELDEETERMIELTERFRRTSSKYRFAKMMLDSAQNIVYATTTMCELEDRLEDIGWAEEE